MFQWRWPSQGGGADDLGEEGLRRGVAVEDAVLAAFLVVEHELHATRAPPGQSADRAGWRRSRACPADIASVPDLPLLLPVALLVRIAKGLAGHSLEKI